MSKYRLVYFPGAKIKAQYIRYLLVDNDIPFDDFKPNAMTEESGKKVLQRFYSLTELAEGDVNNVFTDEFQQFIKESLPLGQLPIMECPDGTTIAESGAIMRHLARTFGLYGNSEVERAVLDTLSDREQFFRDKICAVQYSDEWIRGGRDAIIAEMHVRLTQLEDYIKRNVDASALMTGDQMTFVHYMLFDHLDLCNSVSKQLVADKQTLPLLNGLYNKMAERPTIKAMRETEEFKSMRWAYTWAIEKY